MERARSHAVASASGAGPATCAVPSGTRLATPAKQSAKWSVTSFMGCGTKPLCRPMRQLQCSSDESHTDTTGLSFQATTILAEVCLIVEVAIWRVAKTDTQQKMNGSAKLNLCVWWLESEVRCI